MHGTNFLDICHREHRAGLREVHGAADYERSQVMYLLRGQFKLQLTARCTVQQVYPGLEMESKIANSISAKAA